MSEVRTNSITDAAGTGAPDFPNGIEVSAGNVGIGTASPSAKLDVIGTSGSVVAELQVGANDDVALNFRNAAGTQVGYITSHVDSITLDGDFTKFSTGGTERMRIDASGHVGIGTTSPSPSALLTIGRDDTVSEGGEINLCRASDNASAWGIDVYGSASTTSLRFVDTAAAVERMRIASAGQIGIGGANYGTSGQVLTSGGSGAAPSWASVGTAIAGLAYGAVGTYIYGSLLATNIADNSTYAGSSIVPAGILTPSGSQLTDASGVAAEMNGGGSALSGTWRAMGRSQRVNTTTRARISLFLRIS